MVTTTAPIADRDGFVAALRTHQNPSFLAPLSHLIDPAGPSGRISGLVSVTAPPSIPPSSTGVVQRWPQRWAEPPRISSASDSAAASIPEEPARPSVVNGSAGPPVQRSYTTPEEAPAPPNDIGEREGPVDVAPLIASVPLAPIDPAAPSVADAPAVPTRRLTLPTDPPPVQRAMVTAPSPEPVFRTLTVASRSVADTDASPPSQEAPAEAHDEPHEEAASTVSVPDVPSEPIAVDAKAADVSERPVGLAAPLTAQRSTRAASEERPPAPTVLGAARSGAVQRSPGQPGPGAARPTTPERILGLGAPVEQRPATATPIETVSVQQWAAARDSAPTATGITEAAPIRPPTAAESPHRSETAEPTVAGTEHESLTLQPVQRSAVQEATPATASAPMPSSRPPESVALLGDRPGLLDRAHDDRADAPVAPAHQRADHPAVVPVDTAPPTTPTAATRVQRTADSAAVFTSADARPRLHVLDAPTEFPRRPTRPDEPAPVQRLIGTAPGPPLTMSSALTAPSEPGRAAAPSQRQTVPAPARDTGSIAVSAGIAQRAPDGSVVFDAHPVDDLPALQRAVEVESMTAESAPAPPSVDQAPPEPASAPAATPAEPTAPTAPAVAGAAPANSQNLDELARRLYDPLAARLKAELRLDRERFGLITDLRRP